jgi:electron transfer flavoprotein alpha subunit
MSILVIAEFDQETLKAATRSAITAAKGIVTHIDSHIDLLVMGSDVNTIAHQCAKIEGVARVLVVDDAIYASHLAENMASLVREIAKDYTHVIAAATSFGKNLMPRIAALLDVDMVSEVTRIIDASTFERPLYAGGLNATVKNNETIKLLTIRSTAFDSAKEGIQPAPITVVPSAQDQALSRFVSVNIQHNERPDLTAARVVVSGGRSLGSAEKFQQVLTPLANKLNAAIGATRAAVDAGFAPNESQVGQTGTVVAPELYIAIGVSGAAQHIAGMKDSKIIVAINHDPDAPIFQWADYGLVADLFDATAELTEKL